MDTGNGAGSALATSQKRLGSDDRHDSIGQVSRTDYRGYRLGQKTDSETQALFEFIAHRYESGSLIITSNQPFSQWDQIFPDTMMTVAAIDRIIHYATISEIYRSRNQKKIMT